MDEGRERLKKLIEGQTDQSLLKVVDYLLTLTDMNDKYLNDEKSIKGMVDYIKDTAKKQAKDGYCWVEDDKVYEWAKIYFDKSDDELGIKKVISISTPKIETKKKEIIPEINVYGNIQLSLF